jgi:hypothetical protein
MMTAIVIFSLFVGLSLVGTVSVTAGSTMSASPIGGDGQEFQEEEGQQQQDEIQLCGSSNNNSTNGAGVTDGTNTNTTTAGIIAADNNNNSTTTSSIYENPEYGIQMLCPEDWVSMETENPLPFDFQVTFVSLMDAFEVGRMLESGGTPEMAPAVGVAVMELPFGNADVRLLEDIITRGIASEGQQIISTNPNATLSGMPALEVVTVEPENRTRGMQVWTIQGDKAYGVLYLSHESGFDQSLPIAQDMISSFTITDDNTTHAALTGNYNNTNTTTSGIVGTDNNNNLTTSSVYENPQHGIEIRHPEDWIYMEGAEGTETAFPLDFFNVVFVSPMDAFEVGRTLESGGTPEVPPAVAVMISELPNGTADVRQFGNYLTEFLTSEGQQIISTNPNATLSDMPALEVVTVEPENRTRNFYVSTVQGNIAYSIGYTSHESRFDQSLPIAQDMISSFTIIDETGTAAAPNTPTTNQFLTPSESPPPTTTTIDGGIDNNNSQATSLEAARQQYLQVWNQTEFQIGFNTFIEPGSAPGYGVYEERENNNIFRPGETIQLYAEPVGFGRQPIIDEDTGNTLYSVDLAADIIISDVNGNEIATIEDLPMPNIISHRQNTELHLTLTVTQESPFPVGDYIVSYIVHDQVTGESFEIDKRITITAEEDDNAGTATTIQERQRQQQLQPEQVEWLQYENATFGVGMLYPSDWLQTGGAAGEDGRFVTVSNFYSPEETDWAYVFTAIDNMPTNLGSSLNDTINAYDQDPFVRDFKVLSTSMNNFTLAGMPAYTLEATYTDTELGPQHLLAVEAIIDNKGYAIQYIASPQTYQQYFPIAERMIESFEISQQLQQQEQD